MGTHSILHIWAPNCIDSYWMDICTLLCMVFVDHGSMQICFYSFRFQWLWRCCRSFRSQWFRASSVRCTASFSVGCHQQVWVEWSSSASIWNWLFFVDWMREEDRINMDAFFFGKSSTFGTHFTKQNRIKIKRNSAMKDMTVVFNAGVHVPEQYLPEVAPLVNYNSYRRHY